jgi:hypothetical protein
MGLRHHAPTSAIQGTRVFEDATSSCSRCCSVSRSPNEGFAIFENDDKLRRRGFSTAPSKRFAFNVEYPGFRRASTLG